MKSNFEERKQARLEAFQRLASKNEGLSISKCNNAVNMLSVIPMGQPILVGHHSERGHRRLLEKSDNAMRAGVEAGKKAEYYRDRAESLLSNTAISSDDPNALDKLQEKLEKLEATQELYKSINKVVRKAKLTEAERVTELVALGLKETTAVKLLDSTNFGGQGIPSFRMTNNNAKIKNTRDRIKYLEKVAKIESYEKEFGENRLVVSQEDNRVQIFFPGKPSEEIRKRVKGMGFHWAPSVGAWMRHISDYAIYQAETFLKSLTEKTEA